MMARLVAPVQRFCTVINCMDGRVQLPVIEFLMEKYGADYVDSITEAAPDAILAEDQDGVAAASILKRVSISLEKHGSRSIALAGHFDCAGNPAPRDHQTDQLHLAAAYLRRQFPGIPVTALWVNRHWRVEEV